MKLKIERVEVFGVAMPLIGTFTSGGISKDVTKCVVVRLTASDGTVGISSAEPSAAAKSPGTAAELIVTLRERVAPALVGQDPTNINRLIELLDELAPTQPGAGAAVEMACVDLASRIHGVPIYTYLGGAVQDSVQFNGWIGMLPPEEAAAEATAMAQSGLPLRKDQSRQRRRSGSRSRRCSSRSGRQRDEASHRRQHASTTPTRR